MKYNLLLLGLLLSAAVVAQTEKSDEMRTLFGQVKHHGGFGGPFVRYAPIGAYDGIAIGGGGGYIMNRIIAFGGSGYGFFTEYKPSQIAAFDGRYNFNGGAGGMFMQIILLPKMPIHLTGHLFSGTGYISYDREFLPGHYDPSTYYRTQMDDAVFWILEPGAELELNIFKYLRLGLGAHYRYTSQVALQTEFNGTMYTITEPDFLHGLTYGIWLKFGGF